MPAPLALHPDRLLPSDPAQREIARRLYASVAELPIISPHGHVPPTWLSENRPFSDPTSLLITPDHYVTRLLHAGGTSLSSLGVGTELTADQSRAAFRTFCEAWGAFRGTPVRYWMIDVLVGVFGVDVRPGADTADQIYDTIAAHLAEPAFRPRALFDRFAIDFLATTDDPCDDLHEHDTLAADPSFTGRVAPTFRPDRYLEPGRADWMESVARLGQVSGCDVGTLAGFTEAMQQRRQYFAEHGGVSSDHAHLDPGAKALSTSEAERIYSAARQGMASQDECTLLRRHLLLDQARMACDDGLVMTIHPGVARNHHQPTFERLGPDVGCDIPITVEWTRNLQPLLNRYGTHPNFHLVLFTVDETGFSRELAPLAGFYPSVYVGVPWWFIDAPESILRFRSAVTEIAGFSRTSGMIDDTRAYCSIPARHDMSRRLDAHYLSRLVVDHRLDEDEAAQTIRDLVVAQPRRVFKLGEETA